MSENMEYVANLNDFLADNLEGVEGVKYIASKRIKDKNGNPIPWEIRPATSVQEDKIKKSCIKYTPIEGKKGVMMPRTDMTLYVAKLAAACTVFPNLNDANLQNSYHVMGEVDLLQVILSLPGEYNNYIAKVQEVCGFNIGMEELVDEAKN